MKDITNPKSYYLCNKKKHSAFICMPLFGTCVINKFDNPELISKVGKDYITLSEMNYLYKNNFELYLELTKNAQVVSTAFPLVRMGTRGELSVECIEELNKAYVFEYNIPITIEEVLRRSIGINGNTMGNIVTARGYFMSWQLIESLPSIDGFSMACFVPIWDKINLSFGRNHLQINNNHTEHGAGDFIVCPISSKNIANTKHMTLVNGLVFSDIYESEQNKNNMVQSNSIYRGTLPYVI